MATENEKVFVAQRVDLRGVKKDKPGTGGEKITFTLALPRNDGKFSDYTDQYHAWPDAGDKLHTNAEQLLKRWNEGTANDLIIAMTWVEKPRTEGGVFRNLRGLFPEGKAPVEGAEEVSPRQAPGSQEGPPESEGEDPDAEGVQSQAVEAMWPRLDARDKSIMSQVAAKGAVDLVVAQIAADKITDINVALDMANRHVMQLMADNLAAFGMRGR